ncbi:MAG TPA: HAD family phosphatase [Gammaproteobacteria bacterium]|nr:HAD family phosphatase [Gammaproteobacteria bacterium]
MKAGFADKNPAIVFDLGGVLLDWNPRYVYRSLFKGDEVAMERFLSEVCTPEWNSRQDAGRSLAEATAELLAQYPRHGELIEAYYGRWEEMLAGPIEGTVSVLEDLHGQGHYLCALSNWSAETFPIAQKRYDFLGRFQTIVLSGEERLIKPDPAIFQVLLKRIGRRAEECLFIDDVPANAEGARQLGFEAIVFTSPEDLRSQLRKYGLAV